MVAVAKLKVSMQAGTLCEQLGCYADRIRHGCPPGRHSQALPARAASGAAPVRSLPPPANIAADGTRLSAAHAAPSLRCATLNRDAARTDGPAPSQRQVVKIDDTSEDEDEVRTGAPPVANCPDGDAGNGGCNTSGVQSRCSICKCGFTLPVSAHCVRT